MADIKAIANGNWSQGLAVFSAIPQVGDTVYSNGFTIGLDVDVNLGSGYLTNAANAGISAVAGGGFTLVTSQNIIANVTVGHATNNCVTISGDGITWTWTGDIVGAAFAARPMRLTANNTAGTIIGNLTGGSAASGVNLSGAVRVDNSSGTLDIVGDVTGGSIALANVQPGLGVDPGAFGILTINVTGTSSGGTGGQPGILNSSSSVTVNLNGTAVGGSGTNANGVVNSGGGVIIVNGDSIGGTGTNAFGSINSGAGTLRVNGFAIANSSVMGRHGVVDSGNGGLTVLEGIEFNSSYFTPVSGPIRFKNTTPKCRVRKENGTVVTLIDPLDIAGALPAPGDVRSGVIYNNGDSTGSCAVPEPESVAAGVPVDDTEGTALLTGDAVVEAIQNSSHAVAQRLKNCSTVATTAAQIAAMP